MSICIMYICGVFITTSSIQFFTIYLFTICCKAQHSSRGKCFLKHGCECNGSTSTRMEQATYN